MLKCLDILFYVFVKFKVIIWKLKTALGVLKGVKTNLHFKIYECFRSTSLRCFTSACQQTAKKPKFNKSS